MRERLRNYLLLSRMLPFLVLDSSKRALLREMMAFVREIPAIMQQPLPVAMQRVQMPMTTPFGEKTVRDLADLASALERRSVPGICLKRSLTRYRYLHTQLPLEVVFGARFKQGEKRNVTGHAWLELEGEAWHESAENYEDFTPMFRWP